jgi:hypothetical protein
MDYDVTPFRYKLLRLRAIICIIFVNILMLIAISLAVFFPNVVKVDPQEKISYFFATALLHGSYNTMMNHIHFMIYSTKVRYAKLNQIIVKTFVTKPSEPDEPIVKIKIHLTSILCLLGLSDDPQFS